MAKAGRRFLAFIIAQTSPISALALLACLIVFFCMTPLLFHYMANSRWLYGESASRPKFGPIPALIGIAFSTCVVYVSLFASVPSQRKFLLWTRKEFNPAATFAVEVSEALRGKPPEARIAGHKLAPRRTGSLLAPGEVRLVDRGTTPPSVLMLAVESLRADLIYQVYQGKEITPNLNRLAQRSLLFKNAYSVSSHTDYAIPSYLSSLYPLRSMKHHYYAPKDPWPKVLAYDLLKAHGYQTAIITSDNTAWGMQRAFLKNKNLDIFFDSESPDTPIPIDKRNTGMLDWFKKGKIRSEVLPDRLTMEKILPWVEEQISSGQPFFLHSFFEEPHFPYELRAGGEHIFQPSKIDFECSFMYYPPEKVGVMRNAYFNAAHETDKQVGRLIELLESTGAMENVVLVICGDHGEAFGEKNSITHAQAPIQPVVRIPCILHSKSAGKPRTINYPIELIDILPTVCGLLKIEPSPNFQGIDVLANDIPPLVDRYVHMHVQVPSWQGESIIYQGRWKYVINRSSDHEELFDLSRDEAESVNLINKQPKLAAQLRQKLNGWRDDQLLYYGNPLYYSSYYPPYATKRSKGPYTVPSEGSN